MALPAGERERVREAYGSGDLVLTISVQDRCLWLYPLEEWEKVEDSLVKLPSMDKKVMQMKRMLLGHAKDLSLDGQGRIAIPAFLREYAGLGKKVALLGLGNKYEVWDADSFYGDRDAWVAAQAAGDESGAAMPDLAL